MSSLTLDAQDLRDEASPPEQRRGLLAACEVALEAARAAGATEAEAFAAASVEATCQLEGSAIKLTRENAHQALGLRVFHEGRLGFVASNQLDPESLRQLAGEAVALARRSPRDEHNGLLATEVLGEAPDLCSAELWERGPEDAVVGARALLERLGDIDPRISIDSGSFSLRRGSSALANSRGARAAQSDGGQSFYVMGLAAEGEDVGSFDYDSDFLRQPDGLEDALERVTGNFARNVLGNLGARPAQSYKGPVLFGPSAFADVFIGPLVSACSALAVQRGRSALADKLGERIGTTSLSIVDDPTDRELAGAGAFDREGVPTQRFELVTDGVLRAWLHNGYSAAVDGVAPTGHAAGGTRSVPGLGPHALCVAPGDGGDREAMLASLGRGLLVQRFSGSVDPVSGDFSGVAKSSRWVEGGQVQYGVGETLISGNAFEALGSVLSLSSIAERRGGSMRLPWALVDGLSVTAG
jgi:PmbA protein